MLTKVYFFILTEKQSVSKREVAECGYSDILTWGMQAIP
jgi:uncharacterized protein Veg